MFMRGQHFIKRQALLRRRQQLVAHQRGVQRLLLTRQQQPQRIQSLLTVRVPFCINTQLQSYATMSEPELAPGSPEIVDRIREIIQSEKELPRAIDAYLIPHNDNHNNEYIAPADERLAYVSGFTGSYGDAVVTSQEAVLWTDGRYVTQANSELNQKWQMVNVHDPKAKSIRSWIVDKYGDRTFSLSHEVWNNILRGSTGALKDCVSVVGIDPSLLSVSKARQLASFLASYGIGLYPLKTNIADKIWGRLKPARPKEPLEKVEETFAGKSCCDKIQDVRKEMNSSQVDNLVITALDEIAWLLNIRGQDIPFNPVFFSFLIISQNTVQLYLDTDRPHSREVLDQLNRSMDEPVIVSPYEQFYEDIRSLGSKLYDSTSGRTKGTVSLDPASCNVSVFGELPATSVVENTSPVKLRKSVKTKEEIDGMKQAHIRDGKALLKFFAWLDSEIRSVQDDAATLSKSSERPSVEIEKELCTERSLTEYDVAEKLESFRRAEPGFKSLSFSTISSSGANGAIIHYKPTRSNCSIIDPRSVYLCDSGGQYADGTTDVTRTLHFSEPTETEKKLYTLVLKGHIACAMAQFPEGTYGHQVDTLARQFLWNEGFDFSHGTGHGVGAYLNVHESPPAIRKVQTPGDSALQPGMIFTIEPGYYEPGYFGMRVEDVLVVSKVKNRSPSCNSYYRFESITCAPLQTSLINLDLLTQQEKNWINNYNRRVIDTLEPVLNASDPDEARALQYLRAHRTDL